MFFELNPRKKRNFQVVYLPECHITTQHNRWLEILSVKYYCHHLSNRHVLGFNFFRFWYIVSRKINTYNKDVTRNYTKIQRFIIFKNCFHLKVGELAVGNKPITIGYVFANQVVLEKLLKHVCKRALLHSKFQIQIIWTEDWWICYRVAEYR